MEEYGYPVPMQNLRSLSSNSDDHVPIKIDTIVVSTQHDAFDQDDATMLSQIKTDIITHIIPQVKAYYPEYVQKLFEGDITTT